MPIETYEQALAFWHDRVNYEQRGMPADLGELKLDRMRALLERLCNPHDSLKIVHIAGSKGKGSTAAMLATILQCAGYRTGLFTSPHLCRVEERVQIDRVPISPQALTQLMQEIEPAVLSLEAAGMQPTFFEIVTALGFLHFAREQVDVAVAEVGLGGRFDSTNVCTPLVSVITSISFDHTQQLGNTLEQIATEKAGIVKPHVPLVHGVTSAGARRVIEHTAAEHDAPVSAIERDFSFEYQPGRVDVGSVQCPRVRIAVADRVGPWLDLGLLGRHQAANAAVAVAVVEALRRQGMPIPDDAVRAGLRDVSWPARMELVARGPTVVLDCAHNDASIQALIETLAESFPPSRRLLVFAASRDKDLSTILRLLVPHFERAYFTRYQSSARGADPEELAGIWRELGGRTAEVHGAPVAAWQAARTAARPDDLLVITGSVFLAGELRSMFAV